MYNFWSTSNKLNVETFLNLKKWIWRRRFWQLWYDILNFACVQNWKQHFSTILCWRVTSFCTTCADIFAGLAKYRKQINADHAIYQYYSRINSLFSLSHVQTKLYKPPISSCINVKVLFEESNNVQNKLGSFKYPYLSVSKNQKT